MGPIGHAVVSSAVGGGVWAGTGSIEAGAATVGVGVMMDVDHLFDYYQRFAKGKDGKIYVLFHGWEYSLLGLLILAFFYHPPVFIAAVMAHLAHVATDQWHNGFSKLGYSITFRAVKRFNATSIAPNRTRASHRHQHRGFISAEHLIELVVKRIFQRRLGEKASEFPTDSPAVRPLDD